MKHIRIERDDALHRRVVGVARDAKGFKVECRRKCDPHTSWDGTIVVGKASSESRVTAAFPNE